jgi:RNA polymerase sigma-70 factor (ECF subfamily)
MMLQQSSDEELMAAFRCSGDNRRFEELVSRHTARALSVANAMLGDDAAAEDAVQECFLRLIRARGSYQQDKPFSVWFYTILRNICRDELARRAQIRPSGVLPETATVCDVHALAEMQEESQNIAAALRELSLTDRELLALRIHGGLTFEEIGPQYGLSPDAAKKRIYRALEQLRRRFPVTVASR